MKRRSSKIVLSLGIAALGALVTLIVWMALPNGYERLIPAQAKAVLRLEPSRLQGKAGDAGALVFALGLGTEGIDMSRAVFVFVAPNEYIGFVAAVSDEDALSAQIGKMAKRKKSLSIEKDGGRSWAWLTNGWMLTWDSGSVLAMGPGVAGERDVLRQTMSRMIESGEAFSETDGYKRLVAQGGDAQLFARLDALPSPYNMLFRLGIPPACDPASVQVIASATLSKRENGSVSAKIICELVSENEETVRSIDSFEKGRGCIEPPSKSVTDTTLFVMATRTQGRPLLELLRTDVTLRGLLMGLNQTIDADKMLGSVNGLLSVEISSLARDFTPAFCLKAETHTGGLMADADYWIESAVEQKKVRLNRTGENAYRLSGDGRTLCFGVDSTGSMLYFSSPDMAGAAARPWPVAKSNATRGLLAYFHLNMPMLYALPCMKSGGVSSLIKMLLPATHGITYEAETGRRSTIRIE